MSLTAWIVQFLVEAKEAGYRGRREAALDASRARSSRRCAPTTAASSTASRFAERAWALVALAQAGKFNPAYAAELARKAQFLDLEGVAEVLHAFARSGDASSAATDALARQLCDGLVIRLFQGREIYGGLQDAATAPQRPDPARRDAHRRRGHAGAGAARPGRTPASRSSSTPSSPSAAATAGARPTPTPRRCSPSPSCSQPPFAGAGRAAGSSVRLGGEAHGARRSAPTRRSRPAVGTTAAARRGRAAGGRPGRDRRAARRDLVRPRRRRQPVAAAASRLRRRPRAAARLVAGDAARAASPSTRPAGRCASPSATWSRSTSRSSTRRSATTSRSSCRSPPAWSRSTRTSRPRRPRPRPAGHAHPRADLRRLPRRPGRPSTTTPCRPGTYDFYFRTRAIDGRAASSSRRPRPR